MEHVNGLHDAPPLRKGKKKTRGRRELRLHALGTSSAIPTHQRGVSSYAIELPNSRIWLVDCGDGTQKQFLKANLVFERIDRVLITHLHGDHCYGLFGLLAMLSMKGVEYPVELIGPEGLRRMVSAVFEASQLHLSYPLSVIELKEGESRRFPIMDGWELSAHPLTHRVPCFGYVVQEVVPGSFSGKIAFSLGAKGEHMSALSRGGSVTLDDGNEICHEDCIDEETLGRRVVVLGDTCSSDAIVEAAMHCDLLFHEATYDCELKAKALKGGHSTATQAGEFARRVGAEKLVITHFSARYTQPWGGEEDKCVDDLLREAQAAAGEDIPVVAADDGMVIEVMPRGKSQRKKRSG